MMDFYHVLNRGVEKRNIVLDEGDKMRFVHSLYVFNDSNSVPNSITQKNSWVNIERKRDCLVKIHAWCLMSNHYHLLLSPIDDDLAKLSFFMKKLNGGYAKFFNDKYQRSGYLWQGKYKKLTVARDEYFNYIPYYIHLNPLDFEFKEWRKGEVDNIEKAIQFLDDYRWSSWQDYTGIKNFPSLICTSPLAEILRTKELQVEEIKNIISDQSLLTKSLIIET